MKISIEALAMLLNALVRHRKAMEMAPRMTAGANKRRAYGSTPLHTDQSAAGSPDNFTEGFQSFESTEKSTTLPSQSRVSGPLDISLAVTWYPVRARDVAYHALAAFIRPSQWRFPSARSIVQHPRYLNQRGARGNLLKAQLTLTCATYRAMTDNTDIATSSGTEDRVYYRLHPEDHQVWLVVYFTSYRSRAKRLDQRALTR